MKAFIKKYYLLIAGSLIFLLTGCSTLPEKQAWHNVDNISKDYSQKPTLSLPCLDNDSSLEKFLIYAAFSNPGLKSAFEAWKSSLEEITQDQSLPDPKFTYGYFIQPVETKVGPQRNKFGLLQTFPWYGTLRLRGEAAFERAESKRQDYETERLKLFYAVKESYYDYYYLGRSIAIVNKNLSLFRETLNIIKNKYEADSFKYTDYLKLQIDVEKYAEMTVSLADYRRPLQAKLNYVLNRATDKFIHYPQKINLEYLKPLNEKVLREKVMANPAVENLAHLATVEEKKIAIARRRYIPDTTFGIEYIETGNGSGNVSDNGQDAIIALVSINLPIFFNKYEAERREAEAKRQSLLLKKQDKINFLFSELERSLFMLRDAQRKIELYRRLIPIAEKSLNSIQYAYVSGIADYPNFLDSQQTLLKIELLHAGSLVEYAKVAARLEELTGLELQKQPFNPKGGN
ncbi:MAG: TolC family protein [Victivallaceae bacterium]